MQVEQLPHSSICYGLLLTTAYSQVMTVVKRLVQSGMTLCATINSPTSYGEREQPCICCIFRV